MEIFISDFKIFLSAMIESLKSVFNWFISTTLGEVFIFIILISFFFFLLNLIINFKD